MMTILNVFIKSRIVLVAQYYQLGARYNSVTQIRWHVKSYVVLME